MPDSPLSFESQAAKDWLNTNLSPGVDAATSALIGPDPAQAQMTPSHGPSVQQPAQQTPQQAQPMAPMASHALPQSSVSKRMGEIVSVNAPPTPELMPDLTGLQAGEAAFERMYRPKTSDEATQESKDKPGYLFPDDQGHYYLKGKQLSDYELFKVAPEVWNKRHAATPGSVSADTRGPVRRAFDEFMNENPVGQTLQAIGAGATGGDVPATGLLVDQAMKEKLAKMGAIPREGLQSAKNAFDYAIENPSAVPKDVALAIPKGIHKFGQMTVGAVGGVTEAVGDASSYLGIPHAAALSKMGSSLQNYVSNPDVNSALGIGHGNEDPLSGFLSGLVSMAPALGFPEGAVAPFFGATGFGEAYGYARKAGATPSKAAASALISGATNYLAGRFVPEGLKPGALNPLFREALPQNVAVAALNAAQLTAGQNLSRMVYDKSARPEDWSDALSKLEAGYFHTLPMLMGVHALGAYRAFKAANAEDYTNRSQGPDAVDHAEAIAIARAQDPSTSGFITNLIAQAETPEAAELARQRVRSMFRQKKEGDFFLGQFDKFFPPITNENWKTWGPQIPGVTQAQEAKTAAEPEPVTGNAPVAKPTAQEISPTPSPIVEPSAERPETKSPLQLAKESAKAAKTPTDIAPINIHPSVVKLTDAYGEQNRPESITAHSPETAQKVANRAVAQSMFSLMAGAVKDAGADPNSDDVKATIHNVTNAMSTNNAVAQVSKAWSQMGVPQQAIDALAATRDVLKQRDGIDINRTTLTPDARPIPADQGAQRSMEFLKEFHTQLGERVQNMGVEAPQWLRETVARIGKLVEPGGKYDTAYRLGLGQQPVAQESQHVPVAPIPISISALNRAATAGQDSTVQGMMRGAGQETPTGELTPGASGTEVVSNEELNRAARGDVYYRVDRSGRVTNLGPQPDARVRKGEAVIMVSGATQKPQVQNSEGLGTDKEVLAKFGPNVMSVHQEATRQSGSEPMSPREALKATRDFVRVKMSQDGGALGALSAGDRDRQWARYIDKHFMEMPERLRDFWIGRKARDFETGATHVVGFPDDSGSDGEVHGAHVYDLHEEVAHGQQAAERPTGTTPAEHEAAIPGAEPGAVSTAVPEKPAAGGGADVAEREPERLLGQDREAGDRGGEVTLPPEVQARVAAALEATRHLFQEEAGVSSVRDLHTEVVEDTNWGSIDPYEHGSSPIFMKLGTNSMLFPAPVSSPFKYIANMTPGVIYSGKMVSALGLGKGGAEMIGPRMIAALTQAYGADGAMSALRGLGFDAVAVEATPGEVWLVDVESGEASRHVAKEPSVDYEFTGGGVYNIHRIEEETTKPVPSFGEPVSEMAPEKPPVSQGATQPAEHPKWDRRTGEFTDNRRLSAKAALTRMFNNRNMWGRLQDGTFGYINTPKPEESATVEPSAVAPREVKHTAPIADETQRSQAISDAINLYSKNHFKTEDLLNLARTAGVPMGDEEMAAASKAKISDGITTQEMRQLMNRAGVEAGTEEPHRLALPKSTGLPGSREYTPGELIGKFKAYIKDGGFGDLIYWLSRNNDFLDAIERGERYGRDEFQPVTKGQFQAMPGTHGLGSNSTYLLARGALNRMVLKAADGEADVKAITEAMTKEGLSKEHNNIASLAAIAATKYAPDFFSVSEKRFNDMRQREMAKGAYEDEPKARILSGHFDVRPDEKGGFSPTLDVYNDTLGQYDERLGAGHEDAFDFTAERSLPHQPIVNKLVASVASRGMFTPEAMANAGVSYGPRAIHDQAYRDAVNSIAARPGAMDRLRMAGAERLAQPERMPAYLVNNGYATLMLNALSGAAKRPFHVDAYRIDPEFKDYYTIGEQTVLNLNIASADGMPIPDYVMSSREMAVLLDRNHPMYDRTVEAVNSRVTSDGQIMLAATPMRRVMIDTPDGKKRSVLVPRSGMSSDYSLVKQVSVAPEAKTAQGLGPSGIRMADPKAVAERVQKALVSMRSADADWAQKLGDNLMDQYSTALTALDAVRAARGGDFSHFLDLSGPESLAAGRALSDKDAVAKLEQFVAETRARLNMGKNPEEVAARARAAEILSALDRAKSDVPWESIFDGRNATGLDASVPVVVAQNAIRNREQMISALDEFGIVESDPKTKYARQVFEKINPLFFEELGVNISDEPDLDNGMFDELNRVIKVSGKLKTSATATQVAHLLGHELGHAFTAYMGLPMRTILDRWFESERADFMAKNPRFKDVMEADAVNLRNGQTMAVGDVYKSEGSLARVTIDPDAGKAILERHPDMAPHMREVMDGAGNVVGYRLSRHFAGHQAYRYLNPAEFIAETFVGALAEHARGITRKPAKGSAAYKSYFIRLQNTPGAKSVMDAIHRNIGRMADALVGKNTMRRFIGYLVNQGGTLERGLREGSEEAAFPKAGKPERGGRNIAGGPPIKQKPSTPENIAERDHELASNIGSAINRMRAPLMRIFNPASVSDKSRAAAYVINGVLGELGVNYNMYTSKLAEHYDAAHDMAQIEPSVRRWLSTAAESSQAAKDAASKQISNTVTLQAPNGKQYIVNIDAKGRYQDAMPKDVLDQLTSFERTGAFTGKLAGLEKPLKELSGITMAQMMWSIGELANHLAMDNDSVSDIDSKVKQVPHYIMHNYRYRGNTRIDERLFGRTRGGHYIPTGDESTGTFNSGQSPEFDFAVNASNLIDRKFQTYADAVDKGYFPMNTNIVEASVGSVHTALRLIATMNALSGLFERGLAVPSYDGKPETQAWPTMRMAEVGLPEDMFGSALRNVRVHPDAMAILRNGFQPDMLARGDFGRYVSIASSVMNSTQLFGLNDSVNAAAAIAGFGGVLPRELEAAAKAGRSGMIAKRAAIGAAAGIGAAGFAALGLPMVAGAALGGITIAAARTMLRDLKPMAQGTLAAVTEGKRITDLIRSGAGMNPSKLPARDRNILAAIQATNMKLVESPVQIARMGKIVDELHRQERHGLATTYAIANAINKPIQIMQNGVGGLGGKVPAKIGMFAMFVDALSKPYQNKDGIADFTNDELLAKLTRLADDLDNQIGAIQYRRLHMNPAAMSLAKTMFRAFGFRYTTEKMKTLFAADVINNIGMHGLTGREMPWSGSYTALRKTATGGGTMKPSPRSGSNWAWRNGSLAMMTMLLGASIGARVEAMMSHVIWPDANYSQSDFARRTYDQLMPRIGVKPALAFEGLLSVLPPEGSSLLEAMRHIAYETVLASPEVGPNDPNTGRPRRMIVPGAMYARNLVEHPVYISSNLGDVVTKTPETAAKWFMSGQNPAASLALDLMRGHDAINRPLGWGDPLRNVEAFKRYNEWAEARPDDFWMAPVRGVARSAAHVASSPFPLFVRDIDKMSKGGNWFLPTSQLLGGRTMPPEASLDEAERLAYERAFTEGKAMPVQTQKKAAANRDIAIAKQDLATDGSTTKLDKLFDSGEITKQEYSTIKRSYLNKDGSPRPPIVRFLRRAQDSTKNTWREAYLLSTPKERQEIRAYLDDPHGSGYSKLEKKKIDELIDWMDKQEGK